MKVVLGKKELDVLPLTIEQYMLLKDNTDIKPDELIHMLTGAPIQEIKQAPFTQVQFVAKMLMNEWIGSEDKQPLNLTINFKGKNYGLIKPSNISFEEWINLEVFMAESPLDLLKMAVHLYKPLDNDKIGEDRELIPYSLDECMSRQEEFKKLPISYFFSALFFLQIFVSEFIKLTLSSMETKLTENKAKGKKSPVILHQKKSNNP